MADLVTTQVKASKEVIDSMINMVPGHEIEGKVDFNQIIPMPADIYQGDVGFKERKLYGDKTWLTWCNSNWGTKWNAVESAHPTDNSVFFRTAWSSPTTVLRALSHKFPDERIAVRVAAETNEGYCGAYFLLDGNIHGDPDAPVRDDDKRKFATWASRIRRYKLA